MQVARLSIATIDLMDLIEFRSCKYCNRSLFCSQRWSAGILVCVNGPLEIQEEHTQESEEEIPSYYSKDFQHITLVHARHFLGDHSAEISASCSEILYPYLNMLSSQGQDPNAGVAWDWDSAIEQQCHYMAPWWQDMHCIWLDPTLQV